MSLPEITAEAIASAADEHGFRLERNTGTAIDLAEKTCCALGGAALLIDPRLAAAGGPITARILVEESIGLDAYRGLEYGFEGWPKNGTDCSEDRDVFLRYYAIGEAAAELVASDAKGA